MAIFSAFSLILSEKKSKQHLKPNVQVLYTSIETQTRNRKNTETIIDPLYTKGVVFFGIGFQKCPPPNTHTFNKETNNLLCMNWSCKELLKRNLKEESILPESNTFQVRLIYSLGFRHMHLSLCVQWIQLNASLH